MQTSQGISNQKPSSETMHQSISSRPHTSKDLAIASILIFTAIAICGPIMLILFFRLKERRTRK